VLSFTLTSKVLEENQVVRVNEFVQQNSVRMVMGHNSNETLWKKNKSTLTLIFLMSQAVY